MALLAARSSALAAAVAWLCGCTLLWSPDDPRFVALDAAVDGAVDGGAELDAGADAGCDGGGCADAAPDACAVEVEPIDDFESGTLGDAWQTTAEDPWIVSSSQTDRTLGGFSARSGTGRMRASELVLQLPASAEGARLRVAVRVSAPDIAEGLALYLDEARISSWTGEQPWTLYTSRPLFPGPHRVTFQYRNSWPYKGGEDHAYIDDVALVRCSVESE
jgi:hypothetical protein